VIRWATADDFLPGQSAASLLSVAPPVGASGPGR
jgi:hypothetical protein